MNNKFRTCLGLALFSQIALVGQAAAADSCGRVEGFYATWDGALGSSLPVSEIDTKRLTHVLVAFAAPLADGSMNTDDADVVIDELVAKAHADNTGVFISVGGAGANFLTLDEAALSALTANIVDYVALHNLDGVDIDWESWSTHGAPNPVESEKLLGFLAEIRAALPAQLELSVDVQAGGWSGVNFHEDLDEHADIVRFMAFNYSGGWGSSPIKHHAAWDDIHGALTATWEGSHSMIMKYDVAQTSIGVPFYNLVFNNGSNSSVQAVSAGEIVNTLVDGLGVDYNAGSYDLNGDLYFWETPELVKTKAQFASDNDYPGVFIWELHQDSADVSNQLLGHIGEVLPKCSACENKWAPYPTIYYGGEVVEFEGHNYQVAGGPLYSVRPNTPGHAHRYVDLGPCKNFVASSL